MTEILKQDENSPLPYENQVTIIFIANSGGFDDVPVEEVRRYETEWHDYVNANLPEVMSDISKSEEINEENEIKLNDAFSAFKSTMTK